MVLRKQPSQNKKPLTKQDVEAISAATFNKMLDEQKFSSFQTSQHYHNGTDSPLISEDNIVLTTKLSTELISINTTNGVDSGVIDIRNISNPGKITYLGYADNGASTLVFATTSLSGGDTSATLTSNWDRNSGSFTTKFSNGNTRTVSFINGATGISWTGGLSGSASSSIFVLGPGLGSTQKAIINGQVIFGRCYQIVDFVPTQTAIGVPFQQNCNYLVINNPVGFAPSVATGLNAMLAYCTDAQGNFAAQLKVDSYIDGIIKATVTLGNGWEMDGGITIE